MAAEFFFYSWLFFVVIGVFFSLRRFVFRMRAAQRRREAYFLESFS